MREGSRLAEKFISRQGVNKTGALGICYFGVLTEPKRECVRDVINNTRDKASY